MNYQIVKVIVSTASVLYRIPTLNTFLIYEQLKTVLE